MRPSSSGVINPSGLVDKRLQPMWTKIEQVRQLLPQIAHVSYYMESIFNLDRNLTLLADESVDHHILKDIQIFQGANAYEIALAEGYVGDVTSWLDSLVGPKGDTGLLDETAHQALIDGIAANVAAAAAAQATADAASLNFTNYVPLATYNTRVAAVDAVLADLETTITDVVTPLLPIIRSDTDIGNIAQAKIDTALISVNNALTTVNATLDQYEIDILSLTTEHSATSTAFGEFLVDYGDTLAAITLLTASYNDHETSIVAIQSASALAASNIVTLQANDATFSSQITSLQLAEANAATQINVLQTANNDNYAAILAEQTVRISDIAAAAADRALIRTEFASADSGVLSSATALVDAETTARTTAIDAAAADRSLIRTEFASADSGVLSSATALIDAESTARTTALAAAASDRTLIRTEFSDADDAVAAAAAALVSAESSARSTAIDAVTSSVTTLSSTVGGLSSTVSTQGSTLADINGRLEARYAISVDGGGNGAFVSLEDGTTEPSSVTLSADNITLDGDVFITGSVSGPEMFGNNAISITSAAYTAAEASYGAGGAGNAQSLAVTATGKPILLTFSALFIGACDPGGSLTQSVTLKRNSTTLVGSTVVNNATIASGYDLYQQYCIQIVDTPPAGSHTYYLYVSTGGSDISRNGVSHRAITALEVRR